MKRLIPFLFTTLAVVLSIGLVTAFRTGLFAKVAELRHEHAGAAETETETLDIG